MDVVCYQPDSRVMMEWLCLVYKQDEAEIKSWLDCLRRRGLLQDVDLESETFSMHDLYSEFAYLEVRGKLDESRDLDKRLWAYVENGDLSEVESTLGCGSSQKLIRLFIRFQDCGNRIESLEGINWQYCSSVVVLKIRGNVDWRGGVLRLEPLKCLRSFDLEDVYGLDRVEGLEGLKSLTYFRWYNFRWINSSEGVQTHMGRFPASLEILEIEDNEVLCGQDVLARCTKLCRLTLRGVYSDNLDLSSCSSLQFVALQCLDELRTLPGLTGSLARARIDSCRNLVEIPGLEQLVGLEWLELRYCKSMVQLQLDLQKLTKLQVLAIKGDQFSSLCLPQQLRELHFGTEALTDSLKVMEALKANGLEQLQVLDLSYCRYLTGLENVGDWPALRCLNLYGLKTLSGLPDLSKSSNLEELDLQYCEGELSEEDMCMLARLPLLQPVPIGEDHEFRLDVVRRKGLTSRGGYERDWSEWKERGWEERDLGVPPYKIGPGFLWAKW